MLSKSRRKIGAIIVSMILSVAMMFCAASLMRTERISAADVTEATVTTETELRSFRENTDIVTIYVNADSLDMTSYIRINYGPKLIMPAEGRERVTLNWTQNEYNDYSIYVGNNATLTFKDIDIVITSAHSQPINTNAGARLIFDNCSITYSGSAPARVIYGATGSAVYFKDTLITNNTASVVEKFFFRPDIVFSGSTEIAGLGAGFNSGVVCTDFRNVQVEGNENEGALILSKTGNVMDQTGTNLNGGESYMFYTTDGSDPETSITAETYGAYINTSEMDFNTEIKVALNTLSDKMGVWSPTQYVFIVNPKAMLPNVTQSDFYIDYSAETLMFDSQAIEVNENADFSGTVFVSGGAIQPGSVWYARYKATEEITEPGETYTLNIKDRPATPIITISSVTANSITLDSTFGVQYKLSTQSEYTLNTVFSDLQPDTEYTFNAVIPAGESSFSSETATAQFSTLAAFGEVNENDYTVMFASQTIEFVSGVEANTLQDFSGTAIASGDAVTPGTTIWLRYQADGALAAGPATEIILPAAPVFGEVLSLFAANNNTIVLNGISGAQYRIEGGEWQTSTVFQGLTANTSYTVYARLAGTFTSFPSQSVSATLSTNNESAVTYNITNFADYLAALSSRTITEKRLLLVSDIAYPSLQSNVYVFGDVTIEPYNYSGVKAIITVPSDANYSFYLQEDGGVAAKLTLKNIYLQDNTSASPVTFYLNADGNVLNIIDSKIERANSYRMFSAGVGKFNKVFINVYDSELINGDGSQTTFYRGKFCLYGNSTYTGTVRSASSNDYSLFFDYTDIQLSATMSADFKVSLFYNKLPNVNAGTHASVNNVKLYYTTDGTDPLVSTTAQVYEQPFEIGEITQVRYTLKDVASAEKSALNFSKESWFFRYSVDYVQEKILWDDNIEMSRSDDFATLVKSGASVTPGEMLFARLNGQSEAFRIFIEARHAAPVGVALSAKTDTTLTLTAVQGVEYRLGENGIWQDSAYFSDLTNDTSYNVYFRSKATATDFYSEEGVLAVKTLGKKATVGAADITLNYVQGKIEFDDYAIEVNTNAAFTGTFVASGTDIIPSMTLYARFKADAENVAGDVYTVSVAARPSEPQNVTYTATKNSITVNLIAGAEYRLGDGDDAEWQDSNVFQGLAAGTEYVVYVRIAASADAFASAETYITAETLENGTTAAGSSCGGCGGMMNFGLSEGLLIAALSAIIGVTLFVFRKIRKYV